MLGLASCESAFRRMRQDSFLMNTLPSAFPALAFSSMCPSLGQWPKIQSQLKHGVVPHVICLPFWWVLVMIEGMKKTRREPGFSWAAVAGSGYG